MRNLSGPVARVVKLRGLSPGTTKDKCKEISCGWACATLQHRIHNKPLILKPANLAFNIYLFIPTGFCQYAIFPQLRCGLRSRTGENSTDVAINDRAQKGTGHEDHERPDAFLHTSPCFGWIDSEEGVGAYYNLFWG